MTFQLIEGGYGVALSTILKISTEAAVWHNFIKHQVKKSRVDNNINLGLI